MNEKPYEVVCVTPGVQAGWISVKNAFPPLGVRVDVRGSSGEGVAERVPGSLAGSEDGDDVWLDLEANPPTEPPGVTHWKWR